MNTFYITEKTERLEAILGLTWVQLLQRLSYSKDSKVPEGTVTDNRRMFIKDSMTQHVTS